MTKVQEAVMDTVQSSGHLTADQAYLKVKQVLPSASLSNVYRNLNQFADHGWIRRIQRANKADVYDKSTFPHDHVFCMKCGKVSDIKIDGLGDYIKANCNVPVESFDLVINCICPDCK